MLAHELRNPLAGLSSAIELLGIVADATGTIAQVRDVCRRQIGNLTRMVNDLLDVSRISRGAVELHDEPLDLRDILESALHASRCKLDRFKLTVNTNIASGTYLMQGDPLPGLDGFEVARRARSSQKTGCLKLVALSGYSDPDMKAKAHDAGFDIQMVKPVNPRELATILCDFAATGPRKDAQCR